jgi:hypothetical protein
MTIEAVIGGSTKHVTFAEVEYSICKHEGTCTIGIDPAEIDNFDPFDTLKINANGSEIFNGYVDKVTLKDSPYSLQVTGNSALLKADRTFFKDEYISAGESTQYWEEHFLDLADISNYEVEGPGTVYATHSWSIQTCMDALVNIIEIDNTRLYPDRHGKVCIKSLATDNPVLTFSKYSNVERVVSNGTIRNRAVVFGNLVTADIQEANSYLVDGEVCTVAISTSLIETQAEATRLANAMLAEFRAPLDVQKYTVDGYPEISLNDFVIAPYGSGAVTSLKHDYDGENYTTDITIGERCPSFFGIALITPPLFLSTIGHGVWRSEDNGLSWKDISGTTLASTTVPAIHSDTTYLWAITANNIYRSPDKNGTWELCSIQPTYNATKFGENFTISKTNLHLYDIITKNGFTYCVAQDESIKRIVVLASSDSYNFSYIYLV